MKFRIEFESLCSVHLEDENGRLEKSLKTLKKVLTKLSWFDIINKLSRKRAEHRVRNLKETEVSLSFLLTKSVRKQNKFQKSVDKSS